MKKEKEGELGEEEEEEEEFMAGGRWINGKKNYSTLYLPTHKPLPAH